MNLYKVLTTNGRTLYYIVPNIDAKLVYNKVKNHESKVVTEFRTNLKIYIGAIRKGDMDVIKINNLMSSLDALKADKNYSKISVQLTSEELEV